MFFAGMVGFEPRRDRGRGVATGVHDMFPIMMLRRIEQGLDPGLHETPRPRVQGFLLTPHDVLGVRVAVEILLELRPGEGIQLFDPCNGGRADALVGPMLV